jgi:hypothetical protein
VISAYSFAAFLVQALIGLSIGAAVVGVVSARFITWWATPGYQQVTFNCGPSIQQAMNDLLRYMLFGGLAFAVLVPLLMFLAFYRRRKSPEAPGTPPAQGG